MNILYLCDYRHYQTKMSRVRFHGIKYLPLQKSIHVTMSGPGWTGFESVPLEVEKHKPDVVIWYKPLAMKGFADIRVPTVLRYNEMYNRGATLREIGESGTSLVVCHHANDMSWYDGRCEGVRFANIPHSADTSIFRSYDKPKDIDVLLVGTLNEEAYPFRARLARILPKMAGWQVNIFQHPGYEHPDAYTDKYLVQYAEMISRAKITLTCSSKYKYRLGKYVEIPMCGSLLAADMPNDRQEEFTDRMIKLDPSMSDSDIMDVLCFYLTDDRQLEKITTAGKSFMDENYNMGEYGKRLLAAIEEIL